MPEIVRLPGSSRASSLSQRIVADVRDGVFSGRLTPGLFLGGEKDIAAQYGVSRIVARDALRTLEAMGAVEIRPGRGGGARIAHGDVQTFAEALAVQLALTNVGPDEVLDAQRAIETTAAELAAINATPDDLTRLQDLLAEAEACIDDVAAYTASSRDFHLAVAEASGNRVLTVQLASLQHVAWPAANPTLTPAVSRRILEAHREIARLIAARDAAGARELMRDHVAMIRTRRVRQARTPTIESACC